MTEIPHTMKAFVLTGHGGMDKLVFHDDWLVPDPGPEDVLIKVLACGLNNTDVNTRTGWYSKAIRGATSGSGTETPKAEDPSWGGAPVSFPRIQGADVAGRVIAVGGSGNQDLVGRRVLVDTWLRDWNDPQNLQKCGYFGSERDGGFAEYTCVHEKNVHPVESDLSDAELATFATAYVTAENMLNRARVAAGDRVLITGASGGVGSALIQLANRRGAETIAMASRSKHDSVSVVGPHAILDREPEDLAAALKDATGSGTVSVVADVVGGNIWPSLVDRLERGGRYVCSGAIAGPIVELDLRTLYLRDLTFVGATIVPPGTFADLVGYIEKSEIKPLLARTWPLEELPAAQQAFIDKAHMGNIVVEP